MKRNQVFSLILSVIIITNILHIFGFNPFFIGDVVSLSTILIIPGIILLFILKVKSHSVWEVLLFAIGLSLALIMFGGLLINTILPKFQIVYPLTLTPILASFDVFSLVLLVIAYFRAKDFSLDLYFNNLKKHNLLFSLPSILFPLLATVGAISINNGGTNLFTMILLGSIGIYTLLLIIFRHKFSSFVFPTALYFMGLSLLLMTSLRSWYITGHDIQREYYVFQLTKTHHFWSMDFYKDAYNAMLSITILPTVLSSILSFNDIYIYKLIFQVLFATCPVIIYLFLKKYTTSVLAFLAAFYFMSFPTFYSDMPMLNRQEIGFIFFSLLLFVTFSLSLPKHIKYFLSIIFGFSIVISHYSTNYVLIFILLVAYILSKILSFKKIGSTLVQILKSLHINPKNQLTDKMFISAFLLIVLITFSYLWNSQVTKTSNNITGVLQKTLSGIFVKSQNENKSGDIAYSIFFTQKIDPQKLLNQYIEDTSKKAKTADEGVFYDKSVYEKYQTTPIKQSKLPLTSFGGFLSNLKLSIFTLNSLSRQFSAFAMQIFVFIGLLALLFYRTLKPFDKEYIFLCLGGVTLLALEIILPEISIEYGLLRMFEQLLILLSFPIVIATIFLTSFLKESKSIIVSGFIAVAFFLTLTGFFSTFTGGYYPQMNLNNAGTYYDAYYTRKNNVVSINWLATHKDKNSPVQADNSGVGKLQAIGNISALNEIFPPIIRRNSYVYLTSTNLQNNAIVSIEKNVLVFNSPQEFLNDTKNLIYSNGASKIYK
ncbi:MAG: DUF2206 domain-containing protein [Candidatus Woykebacteria bacterium]